MLKLSICLGLKFESSERVLLVLVLISDLCFALTFPQTAASYLLDAQSGMSVSPRVPALEMKEYGSSDIPCPTYKFILLRFRQIEYS
jgi:hypothetical protein